MKEPKFILEQGTFVVTNEVLGNSMGMLIIPGVLRARTPNSKGVILGIVSGHGGDVYYVMHPDNTTGAYSFEEFELLYFVRPRSWPWEKWLEDMK